MNPATRQVSGFFRGQLSPSPFAFTLSPLLGFLWTTPRRSLRSWSGQSEVSVIPLGNDHFALLSRRERTQVPRGAGQWPCGVAGALEGRRRGKAAGEGVDREQGHKAGPLPSHFLGLQDLQKVGCSSTGEPPGGPGLPSSLSRTRKARAEPRNPGSWVGWVPRALTAGILSSQSTSGHYGGGSLHLCPFEAGSAVRVVLQGLNGLLFSC